MFLRGLLKDAANRRNTDATREKYRRSRDISMQRERSPGTAHDEFRAAIGNLPRAFKRSLTHARGDHDWLFVTRKACERECPGIVAFTDHARAREDKVGMLPSSE